MPWKFVPYEDLRLVYKKVWGAYGDSESADAHREWDAMCAGGADIGEYNELQDLTEVTDYGVSVGLIRQLAERYSEEWETGAHSPKRIAYVVPSANAFGTGRVYGALMETTGINFRVFNDLGEAGQWLGVTHEALERVIERRADVS